MFNYTKLLYTSSLFLLLLVSSCGLYNLNLITSKKTIYIYNYWSVLTQGDKIYAFSFPITSNTITNHRKLHYLMLVYDKSEQIYTISMVGGKNYDPLSEVIIKINYNEYYLPISYDRAWLTNQQKVINLIKDIKESNELIAINTFQDKTQSIDTYSLKGFNEALNKIKCLTNTLHIIKSHRIINK